MKIFFEQHYWLLDIYIILTINHLFNPKLYHTRSLQYINLPSNLAVSAHNMRSSSSVGPPNIFLSLSWIDFLFLSSYTTKQIAMAYKNGLSFISRHKKPTSICTVQYWLSKQGIMLPVILRTYHTVMKLFITPWGHTLDNKEANISQIIY